MAHKYSMRYVKRDKAWRRMFKGKVVSVTCRQLNCPPDKEASRQAANEYWERWLAGYYAKNGNPAHNAMIAIEASLNLLDETDTPRDVLKYLPHLNIPPALTALIGRALIGKTAYEASCGQPDNYMPDSCPVDPDKTCATQMAKWINSRENEYKNGTIQAGTYDQARIAERFLGRSEELSEQ